MDVRMIVTKMSGVTHIGIGFFGAIYALTYDLQMSRGFSLGINAKGFLVACFVSIVMGVLMMGIWPLDE